MNLRNCDILVRVSTEIQMEGTSPEDQEAQCRRKAEQLGLNVHRVLYEPGISGRRYQSREQLMTAIRDIETGTCCAIIAYKLDRIGRSAEVIHRVANRVTRAGGSIITCEGAEYSDTANGRMQLGMIAIFAEFERDLIVERTHAQRLVKASKGLQMARASQPYGYRIITDREATETGKVAGSYEIDEEKAKIVQQMFERYARGSSLRGVMLWLRDMGIRSPRDRDLWSAKTILEMFQNPIYKGQGYYNRRDHNRTEDEDGTFKSTIKWRPEKEWLPIEAPAIITDELWDRVKEAMGRNKAILSGHKKHDYLLSGLMRCPTCMSKMSGSTSYNKKNGATWRFYVCNKRVIRNGGGTCQSKVAAQRVEMQVMEWFRRRLEDPRTLVAEIEEMKAARKANDVHGATRADLEHRISELDKQEIGVARAQVEAIVAGRSTEVYDTLLGEINDKRIAALTRLSSIPSVRADAVDEVYLAELVRDITEVWYGGELTVAELREMLSAAIEEVHYNGPDEEVTIKLRV